MNILLTIKDFLSSWWPQKKEIRQQENWAFHNEYLMRTFFPKFSRYQDAQGIMEDVLRGLEKIDECDCLYEKARLIKDCRKAVEILIEK